MDDRIVNWFEHHPPGMDQIHQFQRIRRAAMFLAQTILENTPKSADQSDAIRKVREAVMTANASIACRGK